MILPINVVILNNRLPGHVLSGRRCSTARNYSGLPARADRARSDRENEVLRSRRLSCPISSIGRGPRRPWNAREGHRRVVPALRKAFDTNGPVVVECIVKPDENVYPNGAAGRLIDRDDQQHGVKLRRGLIAEFGLDSSVQFIGGQHHEACDHRPRPKTNPGCLLESLDLSLCSSAGHRSLMMHTTSLSLTLNTLVLVDSALRRAHPYNHRKPERWRRLRTLRSRA